ncbi:mobilisation protein (MobC) [Marinobacter antarcticus]|jgi:hypothetical protein|uniref:Mobilisation protein (MobC) n=1 Tax=Marinobacter antarcticus TaxID=564117 RepID=A0A1M6W9J2_9GAMM|nr:MobC family plasmid mobilization relaxosome protein [Marinobacter antarcticus]SHK90299.1 mobilisation protein (MobC) [Marinobacter antarcticus]
MKRDKWVHVKVSESEKGSWHRMAELSGLTLADLIRQHMSAAKLVYREPVKKRRVKRVDPALIRELSKIGNNLNQVSRWANTYKSDAEAMAVIRALLAVERQLADIPTQPGRRDQEEDPDAH